MTVQIDAGTVEDGSSTVALAFASTVDATGTHRTYRATVGPNLLGSDYMVGWRQVGGPEAPRPTTPSDDVVEEVKQHFESRGFDVWRGVETDA